MAAVIISLLSMAPAPNTALAASSTPSLRFVSVSGYQLAVTGRGWAHNARVVFSVQEPTVAAGLEVRTTKKGRFLIGLADISMCDRPTFLAQDFHGRRAKLTGPRSAVRLDSIRRSHNCTFCRADRRSTRP
jgi:hypothetical protein